MTTVTLDLNAFRAQFPQFASTAQYADVAIQAQFTMATAHMQADVTGDMTLAQQTAALYLMTAHLLQLQNIIAQNGYTGQPGVIQAATVDSVSLTLQPPPVRGQWRWWLQTTSYGAQLVALLDALSAGGFFVGGLPEREAFRKVGGIF